MKRIIIILILLPLMAASCREEATTFSADVPDKPGLDETITIPKKIISLNPAISEELYLLNADNLLIANTLYCNRPADAKSKKKIGNIKNFDIEMLLFLNPDLVLASSLVNNKKIDKLKQVGVKVIEFPQARSFSELCDNFLRLGVIINKKDMAKKIIARVKKQVARIRKITGKFQNKKVFVQIGAKPLVTVIKDSFIHDCVVYSGGINIAANSKSFLFSRESALQLNPDVIIITTMGIIGEEEKQIWRRFKTINAVINNDIYIVDSDIFCNPTPIAFLESLKIITSLLYPEVKI